MGRQIFRFRFSTNSSFLSPLLFLLLGSGTLKTQPDVPSQRVRFRFTEDVRRIVVRCGSLFTNRTLEADLRYPISDVVPILGQLVRPSFPRQFVTEKESVTVYLPDRSIARCRQSERSPRKLLSRAFQGSPSVALFPLARASSFPARLNFDNFDK